MYLDLDEPQGYRYSNDQRSAKLALGLLSVMSIITAGGLAFLVKCISYTG